jgi:hypothetical protein
VEQTLNGDGVLRRKKVAVQSHFHFVYLWGVCQQFFNLFWLIMSNFSSVLIIFHQFFTWISLGDVDLCFSPMLVSKANAFEEESK